MTAVDAQSHWISARVPNDQFLLYAFDGHPGDLGVVLSGLYARAAACPDLRLRVVDDCALRYPRWVDGGVDDRQFVRPGPAGLSWTQCLDEITRLADAQLDPIRACWRLHLFLDVTAAPGTSAAVTVAVLQMTHALADGTRSAELAGWLFGRDRRPAPIAGPGRANPFVRGVRAARAQRRLADDIAAGRIPAPPAPRRPLLTNQAPVGVRRLGTLVRHRSQLGSDATVTVAVLAAIGAALTGHLRARGADADTLGAEVPMAHTGERNAYNNFRNVGIGLHPDADHAQRRRLIAGELTGAARRGAHPGMRAERQALQATPAVLLRWGVGQFDPMTRVELVTGNTVVSSVNRGAADLRLGTARVLLTAGYPALSPMMSLTHGIHGVGDVVALSVHAGEPAFGPAAFDDYLARLDFALG
jgi:hypothetical protein